MPNWTTNHLTVSDSFDNIHSLVGDNFDMSKIDNSFNTTTIDVFSNKNKNSFSFSTQNFPPVDEVCKLSKLFPGTKFTLEFADEIYGQGVGVYEICNGDVKHKFEPEDLTADAFKLSEKVLEY